MTPRARLANSDLSGYLPPTHPAINRQPKSITTSILSYLIKLICIIGKGKTPTAKQCTTSADLAIRNPWYAIQHSCVGSTAFDKQLKCILDIFTPFWYTMVEFSSCTLGHFTRQVGSFGVMVCFSCFLIFIAGESEMEGVTHKLCFSFWRAWCPLLESR